LYQGTSSPRLLSYQDLLCTDSSQLKEVRSLSYIGFWTEKYLISSEHKKHVQYLLINIKEASLFLEGVAAACVGECCSSVFSENMQVCLDCKPECPACLLLPFYMLVLFHSCCSSAALQV